MSAQIVRIRGYLNLQSKNKYNRVEENQFLYPLFFTFSPGTDFHDGAYAIDNRGRFAYDGDSDVDYYSYGSPNTRYGNSAIDVGMNGGVGNSYYAVVDNSYGYKMAALRARIGMIAAIT